MLLIIRTNIYQDYGKHFTCVNSFHLHKPCEVGLSALIQQMRKQRHSEASKPPNDTQPTEMAPR